MVQQRASHTKTKLGGFRGHVGRQIEPVGIRQRGLHAKSPDLPRNHKNLWRHRVFSTGGYVCKSGKFPTKPICKSVAPPSSNGGKCLGNAFGKTVHERVRQPPVECNTTMASETPRKPTHNVFDDCTLLGWDNVVAPINSVAREKDPHNFSAAPMGHVLQLPGGVNAPHQMAPTLSSLIRQGLQRKEIPNENINAYMNKLNTLSRYEKAFQRLWYFCISEGGTPQSMTVDEAASWLVRFTDVDPHGARNAYSGMLLIPGWEALGFSRTLQPCKKVWDSSVPKYGDFWDARKVLLRLREEPLN